MPSIASRLGLRALSRLVDLRPGEGRAVALSCVYFFFVLSAYYILRPIRDEMGAAGGVENLPWLFMGTLTGTLLVQPLFAGLVARMPRRRFIPWSYRFFMLNLVGFFLAYRALPVEETVWLGRGFFVWVSVFNLFVVSVFWSFMADLWRTDQGKRLFGLVGVGGTAGAIAGAGLTAALVGRVGVAGLLLVSAAFLEIAVQCVRRLGSAPGGADRRAEPAPEAAIGGGVWAGLTHALRSPYLLGISLYMLLYTVTSTFLYFQEIDIVSRSFADRASRTAFFAKVDLLVNVLTVTMQLFLTGRLIRLLGVGVTLALVPAASMLGFGALGVVPTLAAIVVFKVLRRAGDFALARPSREVLFTVLEREDKYKAKNFLDTFVYRVGDQVGAWTYAGLGWLGLGLASISLAAVPLSAGWLLVSLWLGARQRALAGEAKAPAGAPVPAPAAT